VKIGLLFKYIMQPYGIIFMAFAWSGVARHQLPRRGGLAESSSLKETLLEDFCIKTGIVECDEALQKCKKESKKSNWSCMNDESQTCVTEDGPACFQHVTKCVQDSKSSDADEARSCALSSRFLDDSSSTDESSRLVTCKKASATLMDAYQKYETTWETEHCDDSKGGNTATNEVNEVNPTCDKADQRNKEAGEAFNRAWEENECEGFMP